MFAISHNDHSFEDYPYFPTEAEAVKTGKDMMWEAGQDKLYVAEVSSMNIQYPLDADSVLTALAHDIDSAIPGIGQEWYTSITDEQEKLLKDKLSVAVREFLSENGLLPASDLYNVIGIYNLKLEAN